MLYDVYGKMGKEYYLSVEAVPYWFAKMCRNNDRLMYPEFPITSVIRPTKRAADVKPRRAAKVKSRKASRG